MTYKVIRTLLLVIVFVGVLVTYRTVIAEHNLSCEDAYDIKIYARCLVSEKWNESEWSAFDYIIEMESNWDSTAQNPHSTAFGLGQFLDATWETVGFEKTDNPRKQILATVKYIDQRYGSPQEAQNYWKRNKHY